jgi:patatin-related protein
VTAPAPTQIGPQTQELRFATAMTGGVSLAIWIGGIARELNLLQRASDRREGLTALPELVAGAPDANVEAIYLRLLDLLDLTADVDVLAGTSAGGINAALLGLARVNGIDLAPMRDLWVQLGGFERLLRDAARDDAPSLLQGDGVLLQGLRDALEALWRTRHAPSARPTTLHLTTTLIAGETSRFTDAYGTLVQDVNHHGSFRFDERQLAEERVCGALATAARSTASFPLAFEPGFLGMDDDAGRPGMKRYANITRAHWVADGGLLANRPIQPLLRDVFERAADRQVRRVLLYVIPSAGGQPDPRATPEPARLSEPLSAAEALLGDLGAVLEQSIAADLAAFREHNDRVDARCDTRLRLAKLGLRVRKTAIADLDADAIDGLRLLDRSMLEDYVARESDWLVRPVIAALMNDIGSRPEARLPANWKHALRPGEPIEEECRAAAARTLATSWSVARSVDSSYRVLSRFGLAAFDGAKATVISMLRSGFVLARDAADRAALGNTLRDVHQTVADPSAPDLVDLVRGLLDQLLDAGREIALPAFAAELAEHYWDVLSPSGGALASAWQQLGAAVHASRDGTLGELARAFRPVVTSVAEPARGEPLAPIRRDRPSRERAAIELITYVDFLRGSAEQIAVGLFDLHLAMRSVLPVSVHVEQPVEFVQISADTRTLLSRRATAKEKLTGMQLHDFGAFYKSSWRANDWTWGRVDGAGWLVHLLLDPRRIAVIAEDLPALVNGPHRATAFYRRLRVVLGLADGLDAGDAKPPPEIADELSFLDDPDPDAPLPKSLPQTSMWVARELQRWIACAELPAVAQQILANDSTRADPWASQVLALARAGADGHCAAVVGSPDQVIQPGGAEALHVRMGDLLNTCTVPGEKLENEVGRPLFVRTVTKAVAVAGSVLDGAAKPIGVLRPVLSILRTITMGGYRAGAATGGRARPLLAAGLVLLLVGVILAIGNTSLVGLAGAALAAIGLYLVALVAWGFSRKALAAAAAASVVVAVLALGAARRTLFGDAGCSGGGSCAPDDFGWVGKHVLPWLSSSFWHVMLAVVLSLGAAAVSGLLVTRRRRAVAADPTAA